MDQLFRLSQFIDTKMTFHVHKNVPVLYSSHEKKIIHNNEMNSCNLD